MKGLPLSCKVEEATVRERNKEKDRGRETKRKTEREKDTERYRKRETERPRGQERREMSHSLPPTSI